MPGYKDTGEVDTVTLGSQGGDINGALYGSGQIDSCYEREDGQEPDPWVLEMLAHLK